MNDDELMQMWQYSNYNPAAQLKQGLLTPQPHMQAQNNNQAAQQVQQNADTANQQMIANANAGQQAFNNGQLQAQQSQAQQMLQQQQQSDAQRRARIINLALMFGGGLRGGSNE